MDYKYGKKAWVNKYKARKSSLVSGSEREHHLTQPAPFMTVDLTSSPETQALPR